MRAKGTGHPLDPSALFHQCALLVFRLYIFFDQFSMVEYRSRGVLANEQLYTARMEIGHIVLRCGTALDKVKTLLLRPR